MRRSLFALLLLLAACAEGPAPRLSAPAVTAPGGAPALRQSVVSGITEPMPAAPEPLLLRAQQELSRLGLSVVNPGMAGGTLNARGRANLSSGWAECPKLMTRDPSAEAFRGRRVDATDLAMSVTVRAVAAGDGASNVTISATPIGTYLNSFTFTPEQGPCRSTGALEQQVLEAMRKG